MANKRADQLQSGHVRGHAGAAKWLDFNDVCSWGAINRVPADMPAKGNVARKGVMRARMWCITSLQAGTGGRKGSFFVKNEDSRTKCKISL